MQAALYGGDRLIGVKAGRAAYGDRCPEIMVEETIEIVVDDAAVSLGEPVGFLPVGAVNSRDLDTRNGACRTGMRVADVAAAEQADLHSTRRILMLRNHTWSP